MNGTLTSRRPRNADRWWPSTSQWERAWKRPILPTPWSRTPELHRLSGLNNRSIFSQSCGGSSSERMYLSCRFFLEQTRGLCSRDHTVFFKSLGIPGQSTDWGSALSLRVLLEELRYCKLCGTAKKKILQIKLEIFWGYIAHHHNFSLKPNKVAICTEDY